MYKILQKNCTIIQKGLGNICISIAIHYIYGFLWRKRTTLFVLKLFNSCNRFL